MPHLVWDEVGKRIYETGLDRGVLYLVDGKAIPWNGLTNITETFDHESSPVYFDGMKINDLISLGDFAATMKAVTYPDEFIALEGMGQLRPGVFVADQQPQAFHLSYRTKIGNDLVGDDAAYKIHIVYNVLALPKDKVYATQSVNPSVVEFEWDISAIPEEIPGFRPTAHLVIDSRDFDPWLLEIVESWLYGDEFSVAELPTMFDLVTFIQSWYRWRVTDNGDGTYTLVSGKPGMPSFTGSNLEIFTALGIYVVDHGDGTFTVYDTYDLKDIPQIKIVDHGDGTWTAQTSHDGLFAVDPVTGYFNIYNANAIMLGPDKYQLTDTSE